MYFLTRYLIRLWRSRRAAAGDLRAGQPPAAGRRARPTATARGPIALLAHQVGYDLRTSWRNPRARFTTFILPILLLAIFCSAFGHGHTTFDGVRISLSRYYVSGIITLSLVTASYGNLVQSVTNMRETGVLKRRRATPVPAAILVASQAFTMVAIVVTMTALLLVLAALLFGVAFAAAAIGAIACTAIIATLAFACVGYLVSGMIGSAEAAMPVVQATMLPLWFLSGVFIPMRNLGAVLRGIGDALPVEHAANSIHLASISGTFAGAISGTDMLVLGAWALAAGALAAWRFSWLPSAATA